MALPAKLVRAQLQFLHPLIENLSLNTIRKGQDKLGELMEAVHRKDVLIKDRPFASCNGAWILPRDFARKRSFL